jgi:hypothetical protein
MNPRKRRALKQKVADAAKAARAATTTPVAPVTPTVTPVVEKVTKAPRKAQSVSKGHPKKVLHKSKNK